jgi:hypothetical protein
VGTKTESGVTVSDYLLSGGPYEPGHYEFRLTNKLPVTINNLRFRILYYDEHGSLMDFEDLFYPGIIPAVLTKTISESSSAESRHAEAYYNYTHFPKTIDPKVEIRVIAFDVMKPE